MKNPKEKQIIFSAASEDIYITEEPPKPAKFYIPDWFKNIPSENQKYFGTPRMRSTVKKCVPFLDAFTSGYMLCVPQDIEIKRVNGNLFSQWGVTRQEDDGTPIQIMDLDYPEHRYDGIYIPEGYDKHVWRVNLYPRIFLPKGYSALVTHPLNRYDLPFLTFSGVVDFDKENSAVMVANIIIKENFTGVIKMGTPIAQIIPFKRENWFSKVIAPINIKQYKILQFNLLANLNRSYQSLRWTRKSYR